MALIVIEPPGFFWENSSFPFNSEIGSVGMGDYESLARFIPALDMEIPDSDYAKIDSVWRYHKYSSYGKYVDAYGKSRDVRAFADRAQLINYDQYRALIEGHCLICGTGTPASLSGRPKIHGRHYVARCMITTSIRMQASMVCIMRASRCTRCIIPADGMVSVVNQTLYPYHDLMLQAMAYDMAGNDSLVSRLFIEVSPSSVQKCSSVMNITDKLFSSQGGFLSLRLLDTSHKYLATIFTGCRIQPATTAGSRKW